MYVQSSQGINYLKMTVHKNYCVNIIYEAKKITRQDHLRDIGLFNAFFTWHNSKILLEISKHIIDSARQIPIPIPIPIPPQALTHSQMKVPGVLSPKIPYLS